MKDKNKTQKDQHISEARLQGIVGKWWEIQPTDHNLFHVIIALIFLLGLTYGSHKPMLSNGWTNFDDDKFVYNNKTIIELAQKESLTFEDLKKLDENVEGNKVFVTQYTHYRDFKEYGMNASGHHKTSLIIFLVTVAVFFVAFLVLSNNLWIAVLSVFLFIITAMHIEAVDWIAARKDQMMVLMMSLTVLVFITYLRLRPRISNWHIAWRVVCHTLVNFLLLLLFFLAIKSKGMAVVLPVVLVIIQYYLEKEFTWRALLLNIAEKIPFIIMAIFFANESYEAQKLAKFVNSVSLAVHERIFVFSYGMMMQTLQSLMPYSEWYSAHHIFPVGSDKKLVLSGWMIASPLVAVSVLYLFIKYYNKLLMLCLGSFVISFGVVQMFPVGNIMRAERYTYFGLIFIYLLVSVVAVYLFKTGNLKRRMFIIAFGCFYTYVSIETQQERIAVWKNSMTLWEDVDKKNPKHKVTDRTLVEAMVGDEDLPVTKNANFDILEEVDKQIEENGGIQRSTLKERMQSLSELGYFAQAKADAYLYLNEHRSDSASIYVIMGNIYANEHKIDSAEFWYQKALIDTSMWWFTYQNMANMYGMHHKYDEAIDACELFLKHAKREDHIAEAKKMRAFLKLNYNALKARSKQ